MKKWIVGVLTVLLLTGCGARETFETVDDLNDVPAMAQAREVSLALPEESSVPSMESDDAGRIYLCDGYTLTVQTMAGGNLDETLYSATGFHADNLAPVKTTRYGVTRYDCVWSAAGEGGDQVGRAVVLDDGRFHYAITVMAPAQTAGELTETWRSLLDSVSLVSID